SHARPSLTVGLLPPLPGPSKNLKGAMKILLVTLCVLATIHPATLSQSNSPQSPVEISGEAHHHPKLENEFVRIWDVTVPAGEATLWHVHRNDNVVVTFADANLRLESATAEPAEAQWKFGEVRFAKATYVHRADRKSTRLN